MSTTWFTSDLHFGHEKIAELRGFENIERHDAALLFGLRLKLQKGDNLWILGDLSAGGRAAQYRALGLLAELRQDTQVTPHLIPGNHDGVHPLHRKSLQWYNSYLDVFESVQPFARKKLDGRQVWLSHFPWLGGGDHTAEDRYATVRLNHSNPEDWLLHGHTHSPIKLDPERRMIQVGVDAWGLKPVSIHEIESVIRDAEDELSQTKEQEAEALTEADAPRLSPQEDEPCQAISPSKL